jgi:hypothetical protein
MICSTLCKINGVEFTEFSGEDTANYGAVIFFGCLIADVIELFKPNKEYVKKYLNKENKE